VEWQCTARKIAVLFYTACPMPIPGQHTTKNAIGSGSCTICNDGQGRSGSP
jgi:hypothetical protein